MDVAGSGPSLGDPADDMLAEVARLTGRTPDDLLGEAVARLHRIYVGLPPDAPGAPNAPTGPFTKRFSERPAEVVLRQVDPKRFELREPFRYDDGRRTFHVPMGNVTDLASVPRQLTWLVPRYGRHTLAALFHDHLQGEVGKDHPIAGEAGGGAGEARERMTHPLADTLFRTAMAGTGVPFVRRWLIWTAVTLRSRWLSGPGARIAAGLYVGLYAIAGLLALPLLAAGLAAGWWDLPAAALACLAVAVSPLVMCWLWGRLWPFGLIAGLTLVLLVVPLVSVTILGGLYLAVEWLFERFQARPNPVLTRNLPDEPTRRGAGAPSPASQPSS